MGRAGDFLVGDELMEIYSPASANWNRILGEAQREVAASVGLSKAEVSRAETAFVA